MAAQPSRPTGKEPLRDAALERAEEEAEGVAAFGTPPSIAGEVAEREEAQGVEVFEDPDGVIPRVELRNGAPGEESLDPDRLGLDDTLGEDAYDAGVPEYPEDLEP